MDVEIILQHINRYFAAKIPLVKRAFYMPFVLPSVNVIKAHYHSMIKWEAYELLFSKNRIYMCCLDLTNSRRPGKIGGSAIFIKYR